MKEEEEEGGGVSVILSASYRRHTPQQIPTPRTHSSSAFPFALPAPEAHSTKCDHGRGLAANVLHTTQPMQTRALGTTGAHSAHAPKDTVRHTWRHMRRTQMHSIM